MKEFRRLVVLMVFFLLIAGITPCVSAFTVTSVKITPQGSQSAKTPMTITAMLDFLPEGNETFPSDGELLLSTELENPEWVPILIMNTGETRLGQKSGAKITLPGWYFSYPRNTEVQMKLTLTGNMPADPSPDKNFLKIQELKADDSIVSTAHVEMPAAPFTAAATPVKKPATQPVTATLPANTPTQKSPAGMALAILGAAGAAARVRGRR